MKKLYPILSVLFLIYWDCEEELVDTGPSVNLWGMDYSIENTTGLNLNGKLLTGSIPPEIGDLTNLERLWLVDNQLTGSIPPEIGNLTKLVTLDLRINQLTGSILSEISNLINLNTLYLSDNNLTGVIPNNICDLDISWSSSSPWVISPEFYISGNQLCPPYPSCIEDYMGEQDTSGCD